MSSRSDIKLDSHYKSTDDFKDRLSVIETIERDERHSSVESQSKRWLRVNPPGFSRTSRIPRFVEAVGLVERLKSNVIIEIVDGHQIIDHWNCSDFLQRVNSIADSYSPNIPSNPNIYFNLNYAREMFDKQNKTRCKRCADESFQNLQVSRLTYRDLRQVFTDGSTVPSIETRRFCIIICLPPLSCVLMVDRVFILVVEDLEMDHLISSIQTIQLQHNGKFKIASKRKSEQNLLLAKSYKDNMIPLEFKCLESLLSSAFEHLDADINHLEKQFEAIIPDPTNSLPTSKREQDLHTLKTSTLIYQDRVTLFDRVFNSIISNPEDMMRMEITKLKHQEECFTKAVQAYENGEEIIDCDCFICQHCNDGKKNLPNPDVEILLEFFDQELEMFRQRIQRLYERIEGAERLSLFHLALSRNRMLQWDVGSGMLSVIFSVGTLISGLFGMNLLSTFEQSVTAFYLVSGCILTTTIVMCSIVVLVIRMVKL